MLKEKLNSKQRGIASSLDNSLKMRLLRPFGPEALQVSRDLRDNSTSSGVIIIVSSTELVACGVKSGSTALLSSRKDFEKN